jgi:Fe2+ transport system protein B
MGTRLLESGGVRLVINQSVVPMECSLRLKIGVVFPLFMPKVTSFILRMLYIKHLSFDITLIYSYT